jgi:hypothetical protein
LLGITHYFEQVLGANIEGLAGKGAIFGEEKALCGKPEACSNEEACSDEKKETHPATN